MAVHEVRVTVGQRCVCEGYYGTVKYLGEVPPSQGEWVGVEWDNPSRGKHNGEHDGVQYFTCSAPNSGSFVRIKKLELGNTFVEVLNKRYDDAGGEEEEDLIVGKSKTSLGRKVELVGREKFIHKYDQLKEVNLRGMLLRSAGPPNEIATTSPNIIDLDLSQNLLLSHWDIVANITCQLPLLNTLNLSENSLTLPADPNIHIPSFKSVKNIYINKMKLQWTELCCILKMFTDLQELHACNNNLSMLGFQDPSTPTSFPTTLQLINFGNNQLSDWSQILTLQHLPLLKTLFLNDNLLTSISPSIKGGFPCLKVLSLKRNNIESWSSVNELCNWTHLEDLRILGISLLKEETSFNARQLIIARIPQIKLLNKSIVTNQERKQSERYYIKRYINDWTSAQDSTEKMSLFLIQHPLYSHLVQIHGLPEDMKQKSITPALKNRLLAINIICSDMPERPPLVKKLPDTMTIQQLKGLIQRSYKIDSSDQKLSYKSHKGELVVEMDDDLKQLSFYSVESGDIIQMTTLQR